MKLLVPPPLVALASALLMWGIDAIVPQWRLEFPLQTPVGAAVILAGLSLDAVSVVAFIRAKTTVTPLAPGNASSLVTGGLYRITRNPMYLGMLLVITGIGILIGNPAAIAAIIGFVAYITVFQIRPEEEILKQKFGKTYLEYARSVRRWL